MIKNTLKRYLTQINIAVLSLVLLAVPVLLPITAGAQEINNGLCAGVELDPSRLKNCTPDEDAAGVDIGKIIATVINILSWIVGVVAVIMIIVGGFKYITSSGESSNISSAKNTILFALIGLVIVALAQVIVRFVLSRVTQP